MLPSFLLPDTLARGNGQGPGISIDSPPAGSLYITLEITRILEQESLRVSVLGSADGRAWQRLAAFPPKSYCGSYSLLLDLSRHRNLRMLRVDWSMTRWTVAERAPVFGFYVLAEEANARAAAGAA